MKKSLLPIFLFFFFQVVAQVEFEPGYYIDDSGNRFEVLILDKDWRSSPAQFTYKESQNADRKELSLEDVQEFGIGDHSKYRRFRVRLDISSEELDKLSEQSEPEFQNKTVFLKQLVEGKADLYLYQEGSLTRFFMATWNNPPEQLIYKKYRRNSGVATNFQFRQQLYTNLNCGNISADEMRKLNYKKKDLINYFKDYNSCSNSEVKVFQDEDRGMKLNIYIKAGTNFGTMNLEKGMNANNHEIRLQAPFVIGAEAEMILPFNRNKWGLYVEPTYNKQSIENEEITSNFPTASNKTILNMDHSYLALAGGIRHYLFLNSSSKFFINGGFTKDIPISTEIVFERGEQYELDPTLEKITASLYFHVGLGFNYSNRLSAEVRYNNSKTTTGSSEVPTHYNLDWKAQMTSFSILFAYRVL